MNGLTAYLEKSALFSSLEPEVIEHISQGFALEEFTEGQNICVEDGEGDSMYIIGEGEVAVIKTMGLAEHEITRLHPGEHFGEMVLISNAKRTATIRATCKTVCARMGREGFDELMLTDARFAQRILRVLTDRLKHSDDAAMHDMLKAHQALSFSLAKLADARDPVTGAHLYRVRDYSAFLATLLSDHPKFKDTITEDFIESIYLVAPLHDIGKVAIPDGILLKEGKLTDIEFQIMSSHTTLGAEALDTVLEYCDFEVFHMARRVIIGHHEKYDGTGYPQGLKGEGIPVEARIMALADIYDALLSKRAYKPAFGYSETTEKIQSLTGTHLDPEMVPVMVKNITEFEAIHNKYVSEEDDDILR